MMSFHDRPVIGITQPSKRFNPAYAAIWAAVFIAGGRPILLTHRHPEPFPEIQGLILGGGRDIFPPFFKQKIKSDYRYDLNRDSMEITYFGYAENHNLPILGICRGAQLINVIRNGTLHMTVRGLFSKADYPANPLRQLVYRKRLYTRSNSRFREIVRSEKMRVNSLHSQAIESIGTDLQAAAHDTNGVIQAIEDNRYPFLIGVQYHPELLLYRKESRRLFRALVTTGKMVRRYMHP
ncbi:gamma-glutamyl-gamma-aminobutyrate hydrolase family protein [Spirochaeta dissipatitropha]